MSNRMILGLAAAWLATAALSACSQPAGLVPKAPGAPIQLRMVDGQVTVKAARPTIARPASAPLPVARNLEDIGAVFAAVGSRVVPELQTALAYTSAARAQDYFQALYERNVPALLAAVSPEVDQALGEAVCDYTLEAKGLEVVDAPAVTAYVQGVVDRLQQAQPTTFHYRVRLVRDPVNDAFCTGGGTIVVNTGALTHAENEAQLACTLGHEMTHGEKRHMMQRQVGQNMNEVGDQALMASGGLDQAAVDAEQASWKDKYSDALRADPDFYFRTLPGVARPAMASYWKFHIGAKLGARALARRTESEADLEGLRRMAKAGYDPQAAVRTLELMPEETTDPARIPFREHPFKAERIEAVRDAIQAEHLAGGELGTERYRQATAAFSTALR